MNSETGYATQAHYAGEPHPLEQAYVQRKRQAEADHMAKMGSIVGSNPDRIPAPPGGMVTIGIILDRSRKLSELANELANRISGPAPEKGEACGQTLNDPMSNLNSAAILRALNGL